MAGTRRLVCPRRSAPGPLKSAVSIDATRLNNKLESWRGLYRCDARVASVGMLPDAFLRCGADARGGVRVTALDEFLDLAREGGGR
jgi:hypothetical protein